MIVIWQHSYQLFSNKFKFYIIYVYVILTHNYLHCTLHYILFPNSSFTLVNNTINVIVRSKTSIRTRHFNFSRIVFLENCISNTNVSLNYYEYNNDQVHTLYRNFRLFNKFNVICFYVLSTYILIIYFILFYKHWCIKLYFVWSWGYENYFPCDIF